MHDACRSDDGIIKNKTERCVCIEIVSPARPEPGGGGAAPWCQLAARHLDVHLERPRTRRTDDAFAACTRAPGGADDRRQIAINK